MNILMKKRVKAPQADISSGARGLNFGLILHLCLYGLIRYVPANTFSVILGCFLG